MMHSYTEIFVHIVFSTKYRMRALCDKHRDTVHAIMCRIAKENGLTILAINSVEDHIHVLGKMHASCVLADTIGKMKSNTTKWLNSKSLDIGPVYWQNGYYARSVDPSGVAVVKDYIERQQEHHQQRG